MRWANVFNAELSPTPRDQTVAGWTASPERNVRLAAQNTKS
jgi:hypothetical protein